MLNVFLYLILALPMDSMATELNVPNSAQICTSDVFPVLSEETYKQNAPTLSNTAKTVSVSCSVTIKKHQSVLFNMQEVSPIDGIYTLPVSMENGVGRVSISIIDLDGQIKKSNWYVVDALSKDKESKDKRHNLSVGLDATYLSYSENRSTPIAFSQIGTTAKAGYGYNLGRRWDAGISTFVNGVSVYNSAGTSARFWGVNMRAGHPVYERGPWLVSLHGGYYYTTMFGRDDFGFRNMAGPQLYPTVAYRLPRGGIIGGFAKFSPVSEDVVKILNFSNREIAGGVSYKPASSRYSLGVTASSLGLKIENLDFSVTTISIGVSAGF